MKELAEDRRHALAQGALCSNSALVNTYAQKTGKKHPLADKTLGLVWLRLQDQDAFNKVADQITSSGRFTAPAVKFETASSGISSFLEPYRDLLWGLKWLLVPALLATMALVIANAISISVRERRTEMAVLKVLGYGPGRILALVLGEALLVGMVDSAVLDRKELQRLADRIATTKKGKKS